MRKNVVILLCALLPLAGCIGDDEGNNVVGSQEALDQLAGAWDEQGLGLGDSGVLLIFASTGKYRLTTIDIDDPNSENANTDIRISDGEISVDARNGLMQWTGDLDLTFQYILQGDILTLILDGQQTIYRRRSISG